LLGWAFAGLSRLKIRAFAPCLWIGAIAAVGLALRLALIDATLAFFTAALAAAHGLLSIALLTITLLTITLLTIALLTIALLTIALLWLALLRFTLLWLTLRALVGLAFGLLS
jgi:hypothetical protein